MNEKVEAAHSAIESHNLNVNGHGVHYLKGGSGPAVLLVHGGASDCRDWIRTISALSPGYSVYAPDVIGFGQSERKGEGYYLSDFTDFILGFIETLGLEEPALVGHSFGGRICIDVALQHPEITGKLVLVDAAGLGRASGLGTVILTGFQALRGLLRLPQPYPRMLTRDGEDAHWLCVDELPEIKAPTLIMWKRHDIYLPLKAACRASKLIPDARLEVQPGIGHAPHQQNSAWFNDHLLDFLNGN